MSSFDHPADKQTGTEGCVNAFNALAEAYEKVSARLSCELGQKFGLSISEFEVMLRMDGREQRVMPLSCVYAVARLSQSATSRMMDRLEARGLVSRCGDAEDRRSVRVRLTDAGKDLLEQAKPVHQACVEDSLLRRLTEEEQALFRRLLFKISVPSGEAIDRDAFVPA